MNKLQNIRIKYPDGVCCEYIDELEETIIRYEKALKEIAETPYGLREVMVKNAKEALEW